MSTNKQHSLSVHLLDTVELLCPGVQQSKQLSACLCRSRVIQKRASRCVPVDSKLMHHSREVLDQHGCPKCCDDCHISRMEYISAVLTPWHCTCRLRFVAVTSTPGHSTTCMCMMVGVRTSTTGAGLSLQIRSMTDTRNGKASKATNSSAIASTASKARSKRASAGTNVTVSFSGPPDQVGAMLTMSRDTEKVRIRGINVPGDKKNASNWMKKAKQSGVRHKTPIGELCLKVCRLLKHRVIKGTWK
jgi:hypothetical protein